MAEAVRLTTATVAGRHATFKEIHGLAFAPCKVRHILNYLCAREGEQSRGEETEREG